VILIELLETEKEEINDGVRFAAEDAPRKPGRRG